MADPNTKLKAGIALVQRGMALVSSGEYHKGRDRIVQACELLTLWHKANKASPHAEEVAKKIRQYIATAKKVTADHHLPGYRPPEEAQEAMARERAEAQEKAAQQEAADREAGALVVIDRKIATLDEEIAAAEALLSKLGHETMGDKGGIHDR